VASAGIADRAPHAVMTEEIDVQPLAGDVRTAVIWFEAFGQRSARRSIYALASLRSLPWPASLA